MFESDLEKFISKDREELNYVAHLEYFDEEQYFDYRYAIGLDENKFEIRNRTTVTDFNQFGYIPMCSNLVGTDPEY